MEQINSLLNNPAVLGILASLAAEAASWVSKKLDGTPLQGDGAMIVTGALALLVGAFQVFSTAQTSSVSWTYIGATIAEVFAASQVWYFILGKRLNILQFGS